MSWFNWFKKENKLYIPTPENRLVVKVLLSFRSESDEWEIDQYEATNRKRGIAVWIANEDYGISINKQKPSEENQKLLRYGVDRMIWEKLNARFVTSKPVKRKK